MERIILVTGANKGIGFEIVRTLLRETNDVIILCSRDPRRGQEAIEKLKAEFPVKEHNVLLEALEVDDENSRAGLKENLAAKFGKLDVVIHNAAIAFSDPPAVADHARKSFAINYFATFALNDVLIPLLMKSSSPRVIILTSNLAERTFAQCKDGVKARLRSFKSTKEVDDAAREFLSIAEETGANAFTALTNKGYGHVDTEVPYFTYSCSKLFLNARVNVMRKQPEYRDKLLEIVEPGFCATDLNNYSGVRSPTKGAETPAWLATENFADLKKRQGQYFWKDKQQIPYFA